MGGNLTILSNRDVRYNTSYLFELSFDKLKQLYSLYKFQCETFMIDYIEFSQIFVESEEVFSLWDNSETCLIDSLEIFSGLCIYSQTSIKNKINFLFEIFDFNDLKSLSLYDIEFICLYCLNSIFHILKIKESPNIEDVRNLVFLCKSNKNRINLCQLTEFVLNTNDIMKFFSLFSEEPMTKSNTNKNMLYLQANFYNEQNESCNNIFKYMLSLFKTIDPIKINNCRNSHSYLSMKWIYGYNYRNPSNFIFLERNRIGNEPSAHSKSILYFVSNVIVKYFIDSNKQQLFLNHKYEVSCFCISNNKLYIGSSETSKTNNTTILIWDSSSFVIVKTISCFLNVPISIMSFTNRDRWLCSVFKDNYSYLVVYKVKTGNKIYNCRFDEQIIQISTMEQEISFNSRCNVDKERIFYSQFLLISKDSIRLIRKSNIRSCIDNKIIYKYNSTIDDLLSCFMLTNNLSNSKANLYIDNNTSELNIIVITRNGLVIKVVHNSVDFSLIKNENIINCGEVINCAMIKDTSMILALRIGYIYIYGLDRECRLIKTINLSELKTRFMSTKIQKVVSMTGNDFLILSCKGDFLVLSISINYKWRNSLILENNKVERINRIIKIPKNITAFSTLILSNRNQLFIFGDSKNNLQCISHKENMVIRDWRLKYHATCITSVESDNKAISFIVGQFNGEMIVIVNFEEQWRIQVLSTPITNILISQNKKVMAVNGLTSDIYLYKLKKGLLRQDNPLKISTKENSIIDSISILEDNNILIITESLELFIYYFKSSSVISFSLNKSQLLNQFSVSLNKNKIIFILSSFFNFYIGVNKTGMMEFTYGSNAFQNNICTYIHNIFSYPVGVFVSDENKSVTLATGFDSCIQQWNINTGAKVNSLVMGKSYSIKLEGIVREIRSKQSLFKSEPLEDNFGYFSGIHKEDLKILINSANRNILPINRYEPCSLVLHHVYGLQTFDTRNNFSYLHTMKFENNKNELYKPDDKISKYLEENFKVNKYKANNTDDTTIWSDVKDLENMSYKRQGYCLFHDKCQRLLIWSISRIFVIVNPSYINIQRFFQGHSYKISTYVTHSRYGIVASAEQTTLLTILIWDPDTMKIISKYSPGHKSGILLLRFGYHYNFLFSVGSDEPSSLEILNWQSGLKLASRLLNKNSILDLCVNPDNDYEFITSSLSVVDIWCLQGSSVVHLKSISIHTENYIEYVTGVLWINYRINEDICKYILVTTSSGEIKQIKSNYELEVGFRSLETVITSIKSIFWGDTLIFVVVSYDPIIRIYNMGLIKTFEIPLNYEKKSKAQPQVQSLDTYIQENNLFILIGLRTGVMIEVYLQLSFSKNDQVAFNIIKNKILIKSHVPRSIQTESKQSLSQKFISFTLHMILPLMVTIGVDHMLYFWNTMDRNMIYMIELNKKPTVCKFSPNSKYLVVGFNDGTLKFYNMSSVVDINSLSLALEKDSKSDEYILYHIGSSNPVLNFEFSNDSSLIAVSYLASNSNIEQANVKVKHVGAYIDVYSSQDSSKLDSKSDHLLTYLHHIQLNPPSLTQMTLDHSENVGISCHFMNFSSDNMYLVVYYQQVDNDSGIRITSDENGKYVVFSIKNKIVVHPSTILNDIQIDPYYFPNHFIGDFSKSNKIIKPSSISEVNGLCIIGDNMGDIYLTSGNLPFVKEVNSHRFQSKKYKAHSSAISDIAYQKHQNFIYTSGVDDECIYQWRIVNSNPLLELDHIPNLKILDRDFLYEIDDTDIINSINQISKTKELADVNCVINETTTKSKYKLSINRVFGHKSFTRRSNISVSLKTNLVFPTGTFINVISLDYIHETKDIQIHTVNRLSLFEIESKMKNTQLNEGSSKCRSIHVIDKSSKLSISEIVCAQVLQNVNQVVLVTRQLQSHFILFDIGCNRVLEFIVLVNMISPILLRVSDDSTHAIVVGIDKDQCLILLLVNIRFMTIEASSYLVYTDPQKISEAVFVLDRPSKFYTLGMIHLSYWKLQGQILEFQEVNFNKETNEDVSSFNLTNEIEGQYHFLSMKFLSRKLFVVGNSNGFIVMCHKNTFLAKRQIFKGPILVISIFQSSRDKFIVGGFDNNLYIMTYCVQNSKKIHLLVLGKIHLYPDKIGRESYMAIQSMIILSDHCLLVSSRQGTVRMVEFSKNYQLDYNQCNCLDDDFLKVESEPVTLKTSLKELFTGFDSFSPFIVDFISFTNSIVLLTRERYLFIYNSNSDSWNTMYEYQFQIMPHNMFVRDKFLLFVFEQSIQIYKLSVRENKLTVGMVREISIVNKIVSSYISPLRNYLALVFEISNDKKQKIEIRKINYLSFQSTYDIDPYYQLTESPIKYCDFSIDEKSLLLVFENDRYTSYSIIYIPFVRNEDRFSNKEEWNGLGTLLSENAAFIRNTFSDECQPISLIKIKQKVFVSSDTLGLVRVIDYSDPISETSIYNCHLTIDSQMRLSECKKHLLTIGETERNIIHWNIIEIND